MYQAYIQDVTLWLERPVTRLKLLITKLTGLIFVKINFGKIFVRFLTGLRKFVFAKVFYFAVAKINAGKAFRVKIETVFFPR